MSNYTFEIITAEYKPKIQSFLKNYAKNEPLMQYLNRLVDEISKYEYRSTVDVIDHGLSFMAITNNGEVIGICLNKNYKKYVYNADYPYQLKIYKCFETLEKGAKLLALENPDDLEMSVNILTVNPEWGGKGIGSELIKQTIKLAIEKRFRQIRTICTSAYSAKIFQRSGFQCANSIKYEDYKEDGEIVFKPDPPHTHLKSFVLKL